MADNPKALLEHEGRGRGEWVGHLLVALPLAHLSSAALFLWCYGIGFGGGLTTFFSASDIVVASIGSMPVVYGLVLFSIVYAYFRFQGDVRKIKDGKNISTILTRIPVKFRIHAWHAITLGIALLTSFVYKEVSEYLGYIPHYLAYCFAAAISVMPIMARVLNHFDASIKQFYACMAFLTSAMTFSGMAMEMGQTDRHAPYSRFRDGWQCGKGAVIRRLGDNYLVALPSQARAIFDGNCQEKMRILPSKLKFPLPE